MNFTGSKILALGFGAACKFVCDVLVLRKYNIGSITYFLSSGSVGLGLCWMYLRNAQTRKLIQGPPTNSSRENFTTNSRNTKATKKKVRVDYYFSACL